MTRSRFLLGAALLAVGAAAAAHAAEDNPPPAGQAASPERNALTQPEIRTLISQLGDPEYSVREQATKKLEQAGIDAVGPLAAAAAGENLEVICRAVRALARILESKDDATFDAVEQALERLEESSHRPAARRAAEALLLQSARRWKRAVARIHELGGELKWTDREGNPAFRVQDPERGGRPYVVIPRQWKGGDAGLVNLKRMARHVPDSPFFGLPSLYVIDGAPVSEAAIDRLREELPALDVQNRGAARLGVSCTAGIRACRVNGVEKNSPADRAGILPNDEIVSFDGKSLVTEEGEDEPGFKRLIKITARHDAGDKVELEILRAGKLVKIEAELTGWTSPRPEEKKD